MNFTRKTSSLAVALLATTMLTQPGPAAAAPGDAQGGEFNVNGTTFAGNWQTWPAVAMAPDGEFVVVWQSQGQDDPTDPSGTSYGIFAQRFNAAGMAQGSEFQVNSFVTGNQVVPAVAMDADGDFVVVWSSFAQDGGGFGVYAQRYNAAGGTEGIEFLVNTTTAGHQSQPDVAMDALGDFVVIWTGQDGDLSGIYAQRFDAAGAPQDSEFRVNEFTIGEQVVPAVAMDADGNFVVAWDDWYGQDTSGRGVFARRYDAAGLALGSQFQVNSFTTGDQTRPAVAMDADGDFVVVWSSFAQDGGGWGVAARRFDAMGAAQGSDFQVNSFVTGNQQSPRVAMDADGDFVVAWSNYNNQDGSAAGVFAQRFDAAGTPRGPEFQVNSYTTREQNGAAVAMDADGDFVVAWQSYQDFYESAFGIYAQRYDGVERVAGDFDGDGNEDILWHNASTGAAVIWLMEGETKLDSGSIGKPPLVWQVAGVGEFNGDGKADILWRNTSTGGALVWQMDGLVKTAAVGIGGAPTDWVIEKLEDSDGDGLSDIFWRNTATTATLVWRMRGYTKVSARGTGGVPADWRVKK